MVSEPTCPDDGRSGSWDGVVVLCAANNWDGIKLADQHMAEHLCARVPVLYVDPPMSRLTARHHPELRPALQGPRLRMLSPGLARLTPVIPPKGRHRALVPLTDSLLRRQLRRALEALGARPRAVIMTQPSWPAFGAAREDLAVYWAQDDFTGGAGLMGLDALRMWHAELAAARRADVIITSSPAVRDQWAQRGFSSDLIPFGCDAAAFDGPDRPTADISVPAPVAGFVGHLNARTDLALLEAVADVMSLLLVGPRGRSSSRAESTACWRAPTSSGWARSPSRCCPPTWRPSTSAWCPTTTASSTSGASP